MRANIAPIARSVGRPAPDVSITESIWLMTFLSSRPKVRANEKLGLQIAVRRSGSLFYESQIVSGQGVTPDHVECYKSPEHVRRSGVESIKGTPLYAAFLFKSPELLCHHIW